MKFKKSSSLKLLGQLELKIDEMALCSEFNTSTRSAEDYMIH
jgi:hypothetical protein